MTAPRPDALQPGAMQPYALTVDRFLEHAATWHGEVEVVTGGCGAAASSRISYAALRDRSRRLSGAFTALGLGRGDCIALMAWNSQTHLESWYGAMGAGIVCHTLNPRLSVPHLAAMIQKAADRVLLVSPDLTALAVELIARCPLLKDLVVLEEPGAAVQVPHCPPVRTWVYSEFLETLGCDIGWGGFDENAPAGLCFTSGTTGAPKGVTYTHRSNYLHTVHQLQTDVSGLSARDSLLVAVPMFHANGWGYPFAGPAAGAKLVFPGRDHDGASLAALINSEGVTVAAGVPTVWLRLVEHLELTGKKVPSLERVQIGGAALPQALMDRLESRLRVIVQPCWGMTEISPVGTVTPAAAAGRRASRAGRPPLGVDLRVTDADGTALPRGSEGRLQVRGASVVERYFGEEQPAVSRDGWFDTGDLALLDGDGYLHITGRAKDLIKSGGEWINPAEIEAIAGALPEVALAAVIGRADPRWGERPLLIIEPSQGSQITDEALLAALRPHVVPWWLPDAIVRVERMPLAMTGKIDKQRLRADHAEGRTP